MSYIDLIILADGHDVSNTICGLPMHEKLRVCSIVLGTANFREEATFTPDSANVHDHCFRGVIRIQKNSFTNSIIEFDWMIGCKAMDLTNETLETYYISAGFPSEEQIMFCTKNVKREEKTMVGGVGCRIDVKKKVRYPQ